MLAVLLPNCVRRECESGKSVEPKIISESDIEPVEYCELPKAYFAAALRWLVEAGRVALSDFLVYVVSLVDALEVTLYSVRVKSLPVLYDEVLPRADAVVLLTLSLEYKSELMVDVP